MYRKRKTIDAVKFTIKHIVKCFEETPIEAEKIIGVQNFLEIFASQYSRFGVPEKVASRLEYLVDTLLSENLVEEVLKLTSAPYPAALKVPILELQMRAYHIAGDMQGFWNVSREWEKNKLFAYTETASIYGTRLMDSGLLPKAIHAFESGRSIAETVEKREMMEKKILEAQEKMNERHAATQEEQEEPKEQTGAPENAPVNVQQQANVQQEAQKAAERHAKVLLAEESLKSKDKKKKTQLSMDKKAVEVEVEEVEVAEEEEEVAEDVPEKRETRKFELTISVTMEELDNISFLGSTMLNTTKVKKSFIVAEKSHIENIQELVCLCLSHDNLLKIDQSLKTTDDDSLVLVTSEEVSSLQYFFKNKLSQMSPNSRESNEVWWNVIKTTFWKVFRGVIRGLIHLFVRGKSCGHLVFNVFVTSKGEGRILPSMEKLKQKQDLKELVDLMKTVIKLPFSDQSDLSFLPHHLNHFFKLVDKIDPLEIHLEFLIDHPFFWNVAEKVDFTVKLRKLIKQSSKAEVLESEIKTLNDYNKWGDKLIGVYYSVYVQAVKRKTIKQYRDCVDIVRYFVSVYTHINEYEYKAARNGKRYTDEMIESGLTMMFPNFYVDMFYCLCVCICKGILVYEDFKGVSTVLSHVCAEVPEEGNA